MKKLLSMFLVSCFAACLFQVGTVADDYQSSNTQISDSGNAELITPDVATLYCDDCLEAINAHINAHH